MSTKGTMHIDEYIKKITGIVATRKTDSNIVLYRGEPQNYPTPCVPNIFRENFIKNYKYFEKNIFDEMKANKLSKGNSYLENAISAQHDGFPSRLLDVTYNSLVALYFACTPYYRKRESEYDDKDGKVFIFFLDKMFCPTGENITNNYNGLILGKENFISYAVFAKNHKLIDHIKINNRIIAQQGAFILFQGSEFENLPRYMYEELLIPKEAKSTLRKELKSLFGIHTGTIYPEAENLIDEIKRKTLNIENSEYSLKSEFDLLLYNLECEIHYYLSLIFKNKRTGMDHIETFEKAIRSYQLGISEATVCDVGENEEVFEFAIKRYNELVQTAFSDLKIVFGDKLETSPEYYLIER